MTEADILRAGWLAYEQDLQHFNQKKHAEHLAKHQLALDKGKHLPVSFPPYKVASLEDFRYWVYQSGDYTPETLPNGDGSESAEAPDVKK